MSPSMPPFQRRNSARSPGSWPRRSSPGCRRHERTACGAAAAGVGGQPGQRDATVAAGHHLPAVRQGGISSTARAGFTLLFGRNADEVHVGVGANDQHVSRRHGRVSCDGRRWTVHNDGRLAIVFPGASLLLSGEQRELSEGYTPLFIRGSGRREHLLEIRVTGHEPPEPEVAKDQATQLPRCGPSTTPSGWC